MEEKTKFPVRYFAKRIGFGEEKVTIDIPADEKRTTAKESNNMYKKASGNMRDFSSGSSGN